MKTEEQLHFETQTAKNFDIFLIAGHFGYSFKNDVGTQKCSNRNGLVIFGGTNSFYDYYQNKGGSPIDFVMQEMECDTKTAIEYICSLADVRENTGADFSHGNINTAVNTNVKKETELVLPEPNTNHKRVYAYLRYTRCISDEVIKFALKKRLVYESCDRHNAVFLGYSRDNEVKHGFIRGTITGKQFRGDVVGSDKAYGFSIPGNNDTVVVFEAPIDLLSYKTLYPDDNSHLLALGMVARLPLDKYLEEYPEIKKISMALDIDAAGINAMGEIISEKSEKYEVSHNAVIEEMEKLKAKDVNELLCKLPQYTPEVKKSKSR
jgi:hypothetical protein